MNREKILSKSVLYLLISFGLSTLYTLGMSITWRIGLRNLNNC